MMVRRFFMSFAVFVLMGEAVFVRAQDSCLTFDAPTVSYCQNWVLYAINSCSVNASPPGGHNSPVLEFVDGSGSSRAVNSVDFQGNWLELAQDGCLCFDYMVDLAYPHDPPPTWTEPKLSITYGVYPNNYTIRANLVSVSNAPMQEDVWYRVCLPIDSCRNGQLPSNGQFTWKIVEMPAGMDTCTAWNTLITNVSSFVLWTDYHNSPSEHVYFDNFCWRCSQSSEQCSKLFARQAAVDTSCCTFEFPLNNLSQLFGGIALIQYQVLGGTMDTLIASSNPFCNYTTSPPALNNTVSGSLQFTPPCTGQITLYGEVNPQTASGQVTVIITVVFESDIVCSDTLELGCRRPPVTRCDSLSVSPFLWPGLNLSGRTFTIYNQKQPASPIAKVLIDLIPDPDTGSSTLKWNGGGLVVDGNSRSWGVANSGIPYYTTIQMQCPGDPQAPQGPAANQTVQFNLGVDYTLNWQGDVVLTVIHCDGDTCRLVYENWCAKPKPWNCIDVVGPGPDVIHIRQIEKAIAGRWEIVDRERQICYAIIALHPKVEQDTAVEVLSAAMALSGATSIPIFDSTQTRIIAFRLEKPCVLDTSSIPINALVRVSEGYPHPDILLALKLYDRNANLIKDTIVRAETRVVTVDDERAVPGESEGLLIQPNPAMDQVVMRFELHQPGVVAVELVSADGRIIGQWQELYQTAGWQRMGMSTQRLPAGHYTVRIRTPEGRILTAPLVIAR